MQKKKAPAHRYQKLLDELLFRVETGTYPVGEFLPTENQLCREFGLSRFTVREALRRMTEMGMVVRLTRQGTRLISDRPATAYVQPLDSMDEVMMHVHDTHLNTVAVEFVSADNDLARTLQCEPGENWLHVCGTRESRDDNLPLSWTDIYVAERYSDIFGDARKADEPIFKLIEKRYGERIAEIEQDISATIVPPTMALALRVRPNSAALLVNRRSYNSKGEIIEISINTQPSLRYTFRLRVKKNGAASLQHDINPRFRSA
jgi:GntR family transcriptional regulator